MDLSWCARVGQCADAYSSQGSEVNLCSWRQQWYICYDLYPFKFVTGLQRTSSSVSLSVIFTFICLSVCPCVSVEFIHGNLCICCVFPSISSLSFFFFSLHCVEVPRDQNILQLWLRDKQLFVPSVIDSDDTPGAICVCETHSTGWNMQGGNDIKWSLN